MTKSPSLDLEDLHNALPKKDWDMLLKGAKTEHVTKDSIIVAPGKEYQRLYEIVSGSCRVEMYCDGMTVYSTKISEGASFGELSFLDCKENRTVIAEEDVDLIVLEGYFINTLFTMNSEFAGRFYRYLSLVLKRRIQEHYDTWPIQ